MVARRTSVFRQAINHETDGVELLLGVFRLTFVIYTPIGAAVFHIEEMFDDVFFGTSGCFKVFGLAKHTIGGGERPQDAGIQDAALVSRLHQFAFARHLAVETTVLLVLHLVEPEVENVVFENVPNFRFQLTFDAHILFLNRIFVNEEEHNECDESRNDREECPNHASDGFLVGDGDDSLSCCVRS